MLFFFSACGEYSEGGNDQLFQSGSELDFQVSFAGAVNVKITLGPPDPSDSSDATFKFKCNKKSCAYKCQLDDQLWEGCKSPKNYFGLADGAHTFKVKAKDKATGKWSKPVSYSWTINTGGGGGGETALQISAGGEHTCALTIEGAVKCWGRNGTGQLGNGTWTASAIPVAVSGLSSGIIAISAGYFHTCALTSGGMVKCWGDNEYAQLGNGTYTDSNVPVAVSNLTSGVSAISAGRAHTCALTTGGAVKCWGYNSYGQLGDGTNNDSTVPVAVSSLSSGVSAISAGYWHTCALTSGGGVKCWGANGHGSLGDGSWTNRNFPVSVSGLSSGVSAISTGCDFSCAVTSGGAVKCWGNGGFGSLGNGEWLSRNVPVDVFGLSSGINTISSAVGAHICALTTGGAIKCWGDNSEGQLGDGTNTNSNVPVEVSGLSSGVSAISAGDWHTCVLTSGGAVKCWGDNYWGQLGNGTNTDSKVPVEVIGFGP